MPDTETAPAANPFTTDAVTRAATETTGRRPDFWIGYSGETISGQEVADFLNATRTVLEKTGWTRSYTDSDPDLPEPDESMTLKAMILTLWRYARQALSQQGPLTLNFGMHQVDNSDAHRVADRVLDSLVAAHTGTPTAQATAWAGRTTRTWDEVRNLLTAGADLARAHGPAGA
ncbi:hypothetical protein [Streptomyces sp. SID8352]|uniref:DUF6197 family protein n=1 Tax=Streptomyces sp. SID8352 TaxID=2690338 RepID=UPI00136A714E|nr:hypothetical protein [Streptomyces sp. SID8352]MYU20798.1 hypothetical protein [Streptomyces sp. SID8352]